MNCPTGFKQKSNANNLYCSGNYCNPDNYFDKNTCCEQKVKCSTMNCPTGFKQKSNANNLYCSGNNCNPDNYFDKNTCCDQKAKCSTMNCPTGFKQKSEANNLYCNDTSCDPSSSSDKNTCCKKTKKYEIETTGDIELTIAVKNDPEPIYTFKRGGRRKWRSHQNGHKLNFQH